jgi:hypothetical protein
VSTPYRQSFGGDSWRPEDAVSPSRLPARIRDDEYYFDEEYYDDWDIAESISTIPRDFSGRDAFLYYDRDWKQWKCTCKKFQVKGSCFHTSRMRPEEVITPNAKYL